MIFLLNNLDIISPLSVLVYLFYGKHKIEGAFKWFIVFVSALFLCNLCSFLVQTVPTYFGKKPGMNLFVYHIGCSFYVLLLYKFFSLVLNSKSRILDLIFLIPFVFLSVLNILYLNRTFTIYGVTSIWVVIKCLSYYAQKFQEPQKEDLLKSWLFWFVSGLFLYFSVAFFTFITYDFFTIGIIKGVFSKSLGEFWLVHNVILAVSCLFYVKAIKCME